MEAARERGVHDHVREPDAGSGDERRAHHARRAEDREPASRPASRPCSACRPNLPRTSAASAIAAATAAPAQRNAPSTPSRSAPETIREGKHEAVENPLGEHRPRDGEPRGACQLMRRLDTDSVAAAGRDEVVDRGADGQGGEEPRRRRLHPSGGEKRAPANGAEHDAGHRGSDRGEHRRRRQRGEARDEPAGPGLRQEQRDAAGRRAGDEHDPHGGPSKEGAERGHASSFVASAPPSHWGQPPDRPGVTGLLQVILDDLLAPQLDAVLVRADRSRRPPPAEKIPVAVELDLDLCQSPPFLLPGLPLASSSQSRCSSATSPRYARGRLPTSFLPGLFDDWTVVL